jgi:glycosyltransferase involved in cell wall biosynthesis
MISGLVSIIIPVFNREKLIVETLNSIQNQSYTNWECIIVDDGSTDSTENCIQTFVEKDNRFAYYHRPITYIKGANSCRNYGFEVSSGEFINWFDSDDVMLPDCLEQRIKAFTPTLDFVIASGYYWNPSDDTQFILKVEPTDQLYVEFAQWRIKIITNSVLFRKAFLENKPLFNPEMKRGQEAEFFARLFFKCQANQYLIVPHLGFLYRQHQDTKSTKNINYNKGYKESLFFYLFENFKRSEQIKSIELLDYFYDRLLKLFITSNRNQHKEVTLSILKMFYPRLLKYDKLKALELIFLGRVMYVFKKSPQKLRDRWLKFKFNWNE